MYIVKNKTGKSKTQQSKIRVSSFFYYVYLIIVLKFNINNTMQNIKTKKKTRYNY